MDAPDLKCAHEHRTPLSTRYVPGGECDEVGQHGERARGDGGRLPPRMKVDKRGEPEAARVRGLVWCFRIRARESARLGPTTVCLFVFPRGFVLMDRDLFALGRAPAC
jgi:hypothetical protein